jgi:hypothetical protein
MNPTFTPPTSRPSQMPSNGQNIPNQSNIGGGAENRENAISNSVARSHGIKTATTSIISTRSEFVDYLKKSGLDLLTSAVEFQKTGDFIQSSYIVYRQHNNQKEPLKLFIDRYPQLQDSITQINNSLKAVQTQMNIISK